MMGININDSTQDFTGQILRGEKTIETRNTRSLDPYIGDRVGLVRTGVGKATLVGYATVGEPVVYDSVAKFRRDYDKHLVAPGSAFDIKDGVKYGYPLMQVEAITPREVQSKGIVARKVNPMTSDSEYLDAVRRGDMATAQRMVDAAAKNAGFKVKRLYHGTPSKDPFYQFKKYTTFGYYFTPEKQVAQYYAGSGGRIIEVFLKLKRPANLLDVDSFLESAPDDFQVWIDDNFSGNRDSFKSWAESGELYSDNVGRTQDSLMRELQGLGYDGVVFEDSNWTGSPWNSYVVFDPSQIKSADPVTYDDAGNVIPLSQRFNNQSDDIRNPYTRPDLRERLKRKIMAGDRGGRPGQWSARKAQLLAAEYEKAGGGYTGGRSKAQRSLSKWTKQDWRTKSGKPSLETGERYLPAAAISALSSAEYAASTRAKRSARGQFSKQPKRIAMKTKRYRNPATSEDFPDVGTVRAKASPQTKTDAFKRWFNGSVVVNRDGTPMVMYHGTGWTNIREFRSLRSEAQIAGFFAFDPEFAEAFAMQHEDEKDDEFELETSGSIKRPSIYPVYLSLKKVFDVRKKEDRDAIRFKEEPREVRGWDWTDLEKPVYISRMKDSGFDGYIDFEDGSNRTPTGIAVFDSRNVKSAYGNRGTFDPMDPDITNPKDPRSAMTQIATTVNTYRKAAKMLGGKVLDYGAGYGLGTDAMREEGLLADSFEPFPEEWRGKRPPTYTDSADIPSESYDSLVSFSVVNVVDPDERKLLFKEVARILRPDGFALITGRTRQDVSAAKIKTPHLEEGGYLIGVGEEQRYQKGFTQAELERYAKEVLGPGFTVETNRALNGASIKITKGKVNPAKRDTVRSKLSRIIEPGDRMLCYDTATGEDFYRLWDIIHTAMPMTKEALVEVEGMLDDDGVLVIESGESPAGLQDHFRKATRYNGLLLVQGPKNPEQARIETEKLRRELE